MDYTQIKTIKNFCSNLASEPDWREVVEGINNDTVDFEVDNVRFIHGDHIDIIQQEELESDLYLLGCFNAPFLSGVLDIDQDVIETMQEAEAFEALGKLIISMGRLKELQQQYSSADGYGRHFNHYDYREGALMIDGSLYHVFDNR